MEETRLKKTLVIVIPLFFVAMIIVVLLVYFLGRPKETPMTVEILRPNSGEVLPLHLEVQVVSRFTTPSGWSIARKRQSCEA
jgi:flagellar biosynthesis/type III secretory pathway M-ring protein FliF/YscJ